MVRTLAQHRRQVNRVRCRGAFPESDAEPRCLVLHLAISIFAPFVCRHTEATNGSTLGGVAQLGIATEISHENYFVEGHEEPFFLSGLTNRGNPTSEKPKNQANQKFNAINIFQRQKSTRSTKV